MDFLTLCKTVRQECGIQGTGPTSTTGQSGLLKRVVDWVVAADLYIQSLHSDWDFLWKEFTSASTTIDSDIITKPSDLGMWDIKSFAVDRGTADGRSLKFLPYELWRMNVSEKYSQPPYSLTVLPNNNLALQNPADGTYALYATYWKTPTLLTNDSDVPLYPERFQRAIVERAKMMFFADIESFQQWDESQQLFKDIILELEFFALPEKQQLSLQSPEQIVVRPV